MGIFDIKIDEAATNVNDMRSMLMYSFTDVINGTQLENVVRNKRRRCVRKLE
jgi:hypothetical protein